MSGFLYFSSDRKPKNTKMSEFSSFFYAFMCFKLSKTKEKEFIAEKVPKISEIKKTSYFSRNQKPTKRALNAKKT